MAHYSNLKDKDINTILKQYGIDDLLFSKILSGGSENTNLLVKTQTNAFVLTICEQKSSEKATELASLLEYLNNNKFNTSRIVKTTKGKLITKWNSKPVMLKEYIEGDVVEDLSEDLLIFLGRELARLHRIKAPEFLSKSVAYGIEHFDELKDYSAETSFYPWLKNIQIYIEDYIKDELPKALIHSDIFYNNIIVTNEGEKASIMDFEEACHFYRIFDIGMMIIGTCCERATVNFDKMRSLIKGYEQEIKLLPIEKNALQAFTVYAAVATAFWRFKNFNIINPDQSMKDHYLAMKSLADFVFNIDKKEFIGLISCG